MCGGAECVAEAQVRVQVLVGLLLNWSLLMELLTTGVDELVMRKVDWSYYCSIRGRHE
jgi:hypothetical protein